MTDNVNHPSHYNNGSVECIDAMEAATVNKSGAEAVCTSNIIKYLWRYEAKNGLEDVKKAQWYINRLIAELEGKPGSECTHEWVYYGASITSPSNMWRRCGSCGKRERIEV